MIKRMTKATSLLVAAAAMMSLVPASAATKLAVKEGTIENAIAFEGGNYVFYGYKTDNDDNGIYFNDGSKDKLLEDVENYDNLIKYGTKYAIAQDGNDEEDQYMIDLSTGKVSDDDTAEDLKSTIQTRLNSLLRKTERYENGGDKPVKTVNRIAENQFGDVWYEYTATTGEAVVTGYTNQSGKYIDASVTANMYVYDAADNRMVKVEEFNKGYGKDDKVSVTLEEANTIAEDSNYIYRVVKVGLTGSSTVQTKKNVAGEYVREEQKTAYYLQKISKAQGDKEDDAYLPKSVESYEISEILGNKDAKDAYDALVDADNDDLVGIRAIDGVLYVTTLSDDEVKVVKLTTKKSEKIEVKLSSTSTKKYDVSILKKADDVDTDAYDVSIDVDGNVWAIYKGEISRSVKGGDFEVVYTCDRSLDRLDVYNEKSLVAWDEDGEVYTTVQEGKEASKDEAEDIVGGDTTVKTGWDKNADGTWVLYDAAGKKLTGWQLVNGTWYYMDKTTGIMQTGWLNDNGTWYYLQANGAMKTGWLNDRGTWYYLQANGAMKTGWLEDTDGNWYYLQANGAMAKNTTIDDYRLGSNGAWIR